jgi:hypothetical protein
MQSRYPATHQAGKGVRPTVTHLPKLVPAALGKTIECMRKRGATHEAARSDSVSLEEPPLAKIH